MIKILPIGGGGEIGANSIYIEIYSTGIILDSGMHPQKTGLEALPDFNLIKEKPVDYALISHAHQDHIGSLPFLVKRFPYIKIITTPQTRAIAELTLHNAVSILKEQMTDEEIDAYSHEEIDLLIKMIDYFSYNSPFQLKGYAHREKSVIRAEFIDAGHILGSASVLLNYKNHKIFYSGDINLEHQALISGAETESIKADTLILECTYGNTDSSLLNKWKDEEKRFIKSLNKILNSGGSVLVPVFALGKMQEILTVIWKAMENNKLTRVPIYTGGIGRKISNVYDYNRYVTRMLDKNFKISDIPQENFYEVENPDKFFADPSIVLAPGGMMIAGTASFKLAKHWFRQKDSAIFFVGFVADHTPGFKVINSVTGDTVTLTDFTPSEKIRCNISSFRFAAHSRREDLIKIVEMINPENVILNHGESVAIDWVAETIHASYPHINVFKAVTGKEILISD